MKVNFLSARGERDGAVSRVRMLDVSTAPEDAFEPVISGSSESMASPGEFSLFSLDIQTVLREI